MGWVHIPPGDPWTANTHGKHHVEAVSRHAIAETGLVCTLCETEVCPRGDYSLVRNSRLGEVVVCRGRREVNDQVMPCGAFLVASPDTEHGDNLIWDKVPELERREKFFSFRRISEEKALKDQYGIDIKQTKGELSASPEAARTSTTNQAVKKFTFQAGEVYSVSDGQVVEILRVQEDGDPHFKGWAWLRFQRAPLQEWNVDPSGKIRKSMRDPLLDDDLFLTTIHRPA